MPKYHSQVFLGFLKVPLRLNRILYISQNFLLYFEDDFRELIPVNIDPAILNADW